MDARRCTIEFVRRRYHYLVGHGELNQAIYGDRSEWFWRFVAGNGKELARSSETYRRRVDAIRSAELTTGCFGIRDHQKRNEDWCERIQDDPDCADYYGHTRTERVNLRWLR